MAKAPLWLKLEPTGTTDEGNYGVRVVVKWWAVPVVYAVGLYRALFWGPTHIAESCDGLEVTDVRFG